MEYKNERNLSAGTEYSKKREASRLVIEDNTIYEIDLECQNRKDCSCKKCKSGSNQKGV